MKTISFFNVKGGSGKSTCTMMYASWLHYKHGIKVAVIDFNEQLGSYRRSEAYLRKEYDEQVKKQFESDRKEYERARIVAEQEGRRFTRKEPVMAPLAWESVADVDTYKIIREDPRAMEQLKSVSVKTACATWIRHLIHNGDLQDYDVLFMDFGASLEDMRWMSALGADLIGLTVIPVDGDVSSLYGATRVKMALDKLARNSCVFLNKLNMLATNKRKAPERDLAQLLSDRGFNLLPDMISFSFKMDKKADEPDILRSTYQYPVWGEGVHKGDHDLGYDNLFIDITRILAKTRDIGPVSDLSFVDALEKKDDPRRQIKGSSYPQYEMESTFIEVIPKKTNK